MQICVCKESGWEELKGINCGIPYWGCIHGITLLKIGMVYQNRYLWFWVWSFRFTSSWYSTQHTFSYSLKTMFLLFYRQPAVLSRVDVWQTTEVIMLLTVNGKGWQKYLTGSKTKPINCKYIQITDIWLFLENSPQYIHEIAMRAERHTKMVYLNASTGIYFFTPPGPMLKRQH